MSIIDPALAADRRWPEAGLTRIPAWIYTDPAIFRREMEVFFYGPSWNYVALECEVPNPGSFRRSWIGEKQVIVQRDMEGAIHVLENRCAHRGAQLCLADRGEAKFLRCAYHQWNYDLSGRLVGVPFRRGVNGKGGMPEDFRLEDHGLRRLQVTVRGGAIYASFDPDVPAFADYYGAEVLGLVDGVLSGRKLELLGYNRQIIRSNWKFYWENIKDPYHATLLHTFYITFGLFRADSPRSFCIRDGSGAHSVLGSFGEGRKVTSATQEMDRFNSKFTLNDTETVASRPEFGEGRVVTAHIFPGHVVQQIGNSLAMRHIIPRGPDAMEIAWTFYGFADDDADLRRLRLKQANLLGPAGFVSMDDSEVLTTCQIAAEGGPEWVSVLEMGGRGTEGADYMMTEALVRAFYGFYREKMGL